MWMRRGLLLSGLLLLGVSLGRCGDGKAKHPARPGAEPVLATGPGTGASSPADSPAVRSEPDPDPDLLSDAWYSRFVDGQKAGWIHVVWRRDLREGRPVVHDHTEILAASTRDMAGTEDRFRSRVVIDVTREVTGELLHLESVRTEAGTETRLHQIWTGNGYDWLETVSGHRESRRVDCAAPCPTDAEAFLSARAARGDLHPGQRFSYPAPNFLGGTLDTVDLAVEGVETLALPTGPAFCWRVRESVRSRPGSSRLWIDRRGVMRRVEEEGAELVSTTEERARRMPAGGYRFTITVPAEPHLPRVTSATRAIVEVTIAPKKGVALPDFPPSAFSREVGREGNRIRVLLTAHDAPEADVKLPVEDPALARYLAPTNLLCSDAPSVARAAARAAGGIATGREAARRLLRFVFLTLRKESGPTASPTAEEILKEGCGDCSEHAVLFVALCRAVGLPARLVSGYAEVGDEWGSHLFTEIWLGRWVGADPSTNELGTRARYLCFGWPDDPQSYPGLVAGRVQGRIRIRTLSFTDSGETVDLSKPDPSGFPPGLLSGLRFAPPPEGWRVDRGGAIGEAGIEGPAVRGQVTVVSGMGDLPADLLESYVLPGAEKTRFAGIDSLLEVETNGDETWLVLLVPYRRRLLQVGLTLEKGANRKELLATLATLLAPTLRPPPRAK